MHIIQSWIQKLLASRWAKSWRMDSSDIFEEVWFNQIGIDPIPLKAWYYFQALSISTKMVHDSTVSVLSLSDSIRCRLSDKLTVLMLWSWCDATLYKTRNEVEPTVKFTFRKREFYKCFETKYPNYFQNRPYWTQFKKHMHAYLYMK